MADNSPDTPDKISFKRQDNTPKDITNLDGSPLRDKDNAMPEPKPRFANKPRNNLAPAGVMGIRTRQSQTDRNSLVPSFIHIDSDIGADTHRYITGHFVSTPQIEFLARVSREPTSEGLSGSRVDQLVVKQGDRDILRHNGISQTSDIAAKTPAEAKLVDRLCAKLDHYTAKDHSRTTPQQDNTKIPAGIAIDGDKADESGWIKGRITTMPGYEFAAKQYDAPSKFGIEGGKISKLEIRKEGDVVMNYDRGWDVKPDTPEQKEALHRIRNGLKDGPQKEFKGFERSADKGHEWER